MMLGEIDRGELLDQGELPGLYMDPCLAGDKDLYAEFLAALWQAGVIRFDLKCRSGVGCF